MSADGDRGSNEETVRLMLEQLRNQRKQDLETHVSTVNAMLRKAEAGMIGEDSEDELPGPETVGGADAIEGQASLEAQLEVQTEEMEYVDEDKYTTVTIEPMRLSSDDEHNEEAGRPLAPGTSAVTGTADTSGSKKRVWTKEKPSSGNPKKRKKKFRYENKVERKANRMHQRAKNGAAAKARKEASNR